MPVLTASCHTVTWMSCLTSDLLDASAGGELSHGNLDELFDK